MLALTRLVLTRKPGEGVLVGPDIKVRLVRSDRFKARLAFEAPAGVPIFREELCEGGKIPDAYLTPAMRKKIEPIAKAACDQTSDAFEPHPTDPTKIIGRYPMDGRPYEVIVPADVRDAFLALLINAGRLGGLIQVPKLAVVA